MQFFVFSNLCNVVFSNLCKLFNISYSYHSVFISLSVHSTPWSWSTIEHQWRVVVRRMRQVPDDFFGTTNLSWLFSVFGFSFFLLLLPQIAAQAPSKSVFSDYFHSSNQENIHSKKTRNLSLLFTFIILWLKHMHKVGICWSPSLKRCRFSSRMMLEFTGNWLMNFKLLFSESHYIDCSACETACNGMHREFCAVSGVYHNHLLNMLNTKMVRS